MSSSTIIEIGKDGFYHPSSEEEIINLVKHAGKNNLQIRCRGAAHSVADAIYTDEGKGMKDVPNKVNMEGAPGGPNLNLMFDKYMKFIDEDWDKGEVEVQAGIHLGADPYDPPQVSKLDNSFLQTIFEKGWTLEDLGGITHQTVSGFLSTGSMGGTTMHDLEPNILSFRVIDGNGEVSVVKHGTDLFKAVGVSMGLLGIISTIRFKLTPAFNVYGQQFTTPTELEKCPIDLFGPGGNGKPSFQEFLDKTEYSRMLWWPQKGVDRVVVWEAVRGKALPAFMPQQYRQFSKSFVSTMIQQLAGSILFTMLGNKGFSKTWAKLGRSFRAFKWNIIRYKTAAKGKPSGGFLAGLLTVIIQIVAFPIVLFFSIFKKLLWMLFGSVISLIQPLTKKGKAKLFMDYMYRSLPMDNEVDDIMMGTEFTEIFIPIEHTQKVMVLLRDLYKGKGLEATGAFSNEIYASKKSGFWMSPSFGTDAIRVDIFWFRNNDGDPSVKGGYYEQFWDLFVDNNIPFRLHWGKFLPDYDHKKWAAYLRGQTEHWDDFMALREKRDPKNIFLTSYWKKHMQIEI